MTRLTTTQRLARVHRLQEPPPVAEADWTIRGHESEACVNGHLYDQANTYRDKEGRRHCRQCRREGVRALRQARRARRRAA